MNPCPSCGYVEPDAVAPADPEALAEAIEHAADVEAEAQVAIAEQIAEEGQADREHSEHLAEIREEGETERARIDADADVAIAEAQADAAVAIAEVLTEDESTEEDEAAVPDDEGQAPEEAPEGAATLVEVPPQEDDAPADRPKSDGAARRTRRAGPRFGRRR